MVNFKSDNFQPAKQLVLDYYHALQKASAGDVRAVLKNYMADDYLWRGMHPFNVMDNAHDVAENFWQPLKQSFTALQWRPDIFYAGLNEIDDFTSTWVCQMGHMMGLFDKPWLGIQPTGRMVFIRYVEFHRVENGKIMETTTHIDIPAVMRQAGYNPFRPDTGAFFIQPGPLTHDGLLYVDAPSDLGKTTLETINLMKRMVMQGRKDKQNHDGLGDAWHDDMIWFGPSGIGATYTKQRYQQQHRLPLVENMDFDGFDNNDTKINHICRMAEGNYGGFFGWPNFRAIPTGGFMELPAKNTVAEFRVVDIYRVAGGKIAENWIFMDLLHFMKTQGVDVLQDMQDRFQTSA